MKLLTTKIIKILKRKKLKISFAESCSGGLISSTFTSVKGSSKVFTCGLVTYSNDSKINVLKVPKKIIKIYGAVSKQCCASMVTNLYNISKSSICLSTTGIAGPAGGTKKKPVGLVYVGLSNKKKVRIIEFKFKNKGRNYIQKTTVNESLKLILNSIK